MQKWHRAKDNYQPLADKFRGIGHYDSRMFSYPIYFISEDYHLTDQVNGKKTEIQLLPNRKLDSQIAKFHD